MPWQEAKSFVDLRQGFPVLDDTTPGSAGRPEDRPDDVSYTPLDAYSCRGFRLFVRGERTGKMGRLNRPLIAPSELETLTARFGPQPYHHAEVIGGSWWDEVRRSLDRRRGEVLLVVQRPRGDLLVHTKAFYPPEAYRLPTGGIGWAETAWEALHREMAEETGLPVQAAEWWGLITYALYPAADRRDLEATFVSFVFYVRTEGEPRPADPGEQIAAFRWVPPGTLPEIARRLESLDPLWRGWGAFRAVGHRFVWEHHQHRLTSARVDSS